MKSCRLKYLIIFIIAQLNNVNTQTYSKTSSFPPLYNFDDYDNCLNDETSLFESTYCMIYAEIKPQNSSKLWQEINQHIEEYKFHYRRDRLFFGVCMSRCKNFPNILNNLQYNDSIVANQITQFFDAVHKRPLDLHMRSQYHALIHNCLNAEFKAKFDLNIKTYIEYCERPGEILQQDGAEKMFYKFLEIILILNILSSLYDYCLKRKQPKEQQNANFYKINLQQPASNLLTAFSLRRNYYRLVEPYRNKLGVDLSYLDGIRSFAVTFVVIGHGFFVQYHHVKNPHVFEYFTKSPIHFWFINGTLLLEVFHILSGLLLLIKFKDFFAITTKSNFSDCVKTFCKGMILRYIRFVPSLAFFISVHATFFTRLQDGPFWRSLTEPGRTFSREKWLKNLLMLDNISESGFPHTWYITTDWQLFAFYFCIVIAINKYPLYKTKILASLAVLAVLIPFSISYFYSLEPSFMITPESFRFTHSREEEAFNRLYTPFYTNLGGYLFGIVCGEIYERYHHNEEFRKHVNRIPKQILEFTFWASIVIGIWIICLGTVVIFKKPSIWTAIYAGLNRNIFLVIVGCGLILVGMFYKSLLLMKFLTSSANRILARLSFQVYMWHFSILYLINGHKREPIYTNHFEHLTLTICLVTLSLSLAFFITIFMEYPFHQIANYYYKKNNKNNEILSEMRSLSNRNTISQQNWTKLFKDLTNKICSNMEN